jgi:biotin-dependent carboxylase-like uncharacterized protein
MDQHALRIANGLVGNPGDAAGIEITLGGFRARFGTRTLFALTGAALNIRLNDEPVPLWTLLEAGGGDILSVGYGGTGFRAYLALAGGIDVPPVMGSRSTYVRGGFGGMEGRALTRGDVLPIAETSRRNVRSRQAPTDLVPPYSDHPTLRVVMGPQNDHFTPEGIDTFLSSEYMVTDRCDRMGILLSGPGITHRHGADIVSDGTLPGAVQVPGDGRPALLGVDCQTTGGYAKIATVLWTDLPLVAQLMPGHRLRFKETGLPRAREIYLKQEYRIRRFCAHGAETARHS